MSPRILPKSNNEPNIIHNSGFDVHLHDNDSRIQLSLLNIILSTSSNLSYAHAGLYTINHPIPQDLQQNTYHSRKVRLNGEILMSKENLLPDFMDIIEDNPWLSHMRMMHEYILKEYSWYIYSLTLINQLSFIGNLNCLPILNINPICQLNPNIK